MINVLQKLSKNYYRLFSVSCRWTGCQIRDRARFCSMLTYHSHSRQDKTAQTGFVFLHIEHYVKKLLGCWVFSHSWQSCALHHRTPGFISFEPDPSSLFDVSVVRVRLYQEYRSFYIQSIFMDTFSAYMGEGLSLK